MCCHSNIFSPRAIVILAFYRAYFLFTKQAFTDHYQHRLWNIEYHIERAIRRRLDLSNGISWEVRHFFCLIALYKMWTLFYETLNLGKKKKEIYIKGGVNNDSAWSVR